MLTIRFENGAKSAKKVDFVWKTRRTQHARSICGAYRVAYHRSHAMLFGLIRNLFNRSAVASAGDKTDDAAHRVRLREAHTRMAQATLPGPDYLNALSLIHAQLKPRTYLE